MFADVNCNCHSGPLGVCFRAFDISVSLIFLPLASFISVGLTVSQTVAPVLIGCFLLGLAAVYVSFFPLPSMKFAD